jgi:hypothetical protein
VLLRYLPRESSFVQAVAGETARWGNTEHLLAGLIDVVQVGNYLTEVLASNRQIRGEPKPPKPIRRPGDNPDIARRPARSYTRAEMREILDRRRGVIDQTEEVT